MGKLADLLPKAWPFSELPGYRDHSEMFATYSGFSYEILPPVGKSLDDNFRWLDDETPKEEWSLRDATGEVERKLQQILERAVVKLPSSFITFLRSPQLQARIRSCTACYLEMPDAIVPTCGEEAGSLIHFLSDQQWCLHWSLYVSQTGDHCVICSGEAYGFSDGNQEEDQALSRSINLLEEGAAFCAPSFMEFLYRFWIENEVWYALSEDRALTAEQRAYVEHYRKQD